MGDWSNGADERILVSSQVGVLAHAEEGAIAEHGLVNDLVEVDPDEDGEDVLVDLSADAFVLTNMVRVVESPILGTRALLTSSSVSTTRWSPISCAPRSAPLLGCWDSKSLCSEKLVLSLTDAALVVSLMLSAMAAKVVARRIGPGKIAV